jgi:lysophospholipase L1-like esterase
MLNASSVGAACKHIAPTELFVWFYFFVIVLLTYGHHVASNDILFMKQFSYLALGDSYTIGEQVRIHESFPYQTVQQLRAQAYNFYAPEIIAVTGFTTDELDRLIDNTNLLPQYDFVSLLIGVNNQYRGRSIENFKQEFEALLQRAIGFSGNMPANVFVLSIPDWGITPFAASSDGKKIAAEIDAFNDVCKSVSEKYNTQFIDITVSQRQDGGKEEFLANDKLHPSGKEYAKWAKQLSEKIKARIK